MKDFILSALLVAASSSAVAEAGGASREVLLAELSASFQQGGDEQTQQQKTLRVGDIMDAFACTADLTSGSVVDDESTCATTTDSDGAACVWCDASAIIGTGLCASTSIQSMAGGLWDSFCSGDDGSTSGATPDATPAVVTPPPTPNPTPAPPPPAPVPAPDDNGLPDALKCTMDMATSQLVTDESTCVAQADPTSSSGEKCVWCSVPIVGGGCITNSAKASMSFLCSGEETEKVEGKYLRGAEVEGSDGLDVLDPACLSDGLAGGTEESCGGKTDSKGESCVWCSAPGDAFGLCATPSQRGYLGEYMTCASVAPASPAYALG